MCFKRGKNILDNVRRLKYMTFLYSAPLFLKKKTLGGLAIFDWLFLIEVLSLRKKADSIIFSCSHPSVTQL